MFCFLVNGLKHAFPGRLLHHAGGKETTENTKFTLPERLCGPARPPYNCQKHMGATQPQREMKSWRMLNDKWMHWINSGRRGEVVCASLSMCEYACVWVSGIYFHLKTTTARTTSLVETSEEMTEGNGWRDSGGCWLGVRLYIVREDFLIGQLNYDGLTECFCCLSCLVLSHPSGKINVIYNCHITLFEINFFFFVHKKTKKIQKVRFF